MVCHSEHTLLYTAALLQLLSQESKGGANIKRLSQEITKHAIMKYVFDTQTNTFSLFENCQHL